MDQTKFWVDFHSVFYHKVSAYPAVSHMEVLAFEMQKSKEPEKTALIASDCV